MDLSNAFADRDETDDLAPGTQFENYIIERVLGKGGFGTTYLLSDDEKNQIFALKAINSDRLSSKTDIENFYAEASKMLQIPAHPNIVRILNAWIDPRSHTPYLSTEYIPHGDLWTYGKKHGRFSNFECWWVLLNVVEGMRFIFETANLLHRDLKPQNLLLDASGVIKIIDFGLAKAIRTRNRTLHDLMAPGDKSSAVGTAFFMSPEQIRGERQVDERSDIWSIGVSLYWLATGKLPFQGTKLRQDIISQDPPRPSTLNPAIDQLLEALIQQCMQKDPAQRFTSFRELEMTAIDKAMRIPDFLGKISTNTRFVSSQAIQYYLTPYFNKGVSQPISDEYAPDGSDWLSYVQRVYQLIAIDNLPLAQEMVTQALAHDSHQPIIRCYEAMLYARSGQFEEAQHAFEQLFERKDPKGRVIPAIAYQEAIRFYMVTRQFDLAHAVEKRALDRLANEKDPKYRKHFEETIRDVLAELNDDLDKSVAQELGLDIDFSRPAKDDPLLDRLQASRASLKAIKLAERGLYEPAIQLFRMAVAKDPENGHAWADLGTCLMENRQYAEAYEALHKARILIPRDFITRFHLGLVSEQLGNVEEALTCYDQALKIEKNNAQVWFQKGLLLANKLRQYRDALSCFEQAQRLDHPDAPVEIAYCRELLR
jgi:serine/threonine protein kinase